MTRLGAPARLALAALAPALLAAGCGSMSRPDPDCIRPTIAVMKFDNRARLPVGWRIGEGVTDILVDRLVATGRFHVIERPNLDHVLREIHFQQTGATRKQNRARPGRLKNVRYLIKGTVTDYGHVSTDSGGFAWTDRLDLFGTGSRAVMSMTLYVVEVESGEIVCSESFEGSVRADSLNVRAEYKDVTFGGSVFNRTPLGRVTAGVIDKAVRGIAGAVAARPWRPKVAQVLGERVLVINGGRNRRVSVGDDYEVLMRGDPIVDPDTGDVIGHGAGRVVGRVRVDRVHARYAEATIIVGRPADMEAGQICRPVDPDEPTRLAVRLAPADKTRRAPGR